MPKRSALLGTQTRQTHFALGPSKTTSYETVYGLNIKEHSLAEAFVKPVANRNFVASFKIGLNDQPMHMTENQRAYVG